MMTLTKKEEKLIASLKQKKFRKLEGCFVVEGVKMVEEAIQFGADVVYIVTSVDFHSDLVEVKQCDAKAMNRMSSLTTPPGVLALIRFPQPQAEKLSDIRLVIDQVQDPGNLGTIIRTAEAMGIDTLICSHDTVDAFSPKVVQASMGSIFRVNVRFSSLTQFFEEKEDSFPVYAAHLEGGNVYEEGIIAPCYLVVGNESKGINDKLLPYVTCKIKIPIWGKAESYNVSIATAIILGEFKRQLEVV